MAVNVKHPTVGRPGASGNADQLDAICPPDSTASPSEQHRRRIGEIRVGRRHRRDLGDIDGLAASIADIGLLQPVVIMPDGMPEEFYEIVRAASFPPYGEAFQRKARPDFQNLFAMREAAE